MIFLSLCESAPWANWWRILPVIVARRASSISQAVNMVNFGYNGRQILDIPVTGTYGVSLLYASWRKPEKPSSKRSLRRWKTIFVSTETD